MRFNRIWCLPLLGALALGACDMDLTDPNNPSEELAVTTPSGLRMAAIGLQAQYSNNVVDPVFTVGLITDEIGAIPETFESYQDADVGNEIDGTEGPSTNTWFGMYDVIRTANVIIDGAGDVGFPAAYAGGVEALGKFYKGLAFGQLFQLYPAAPINVSPESSDAEFVDRDAVLAEALRLLQEASQQLQSNPPPAEFYSDVVAPGFDLDNSVDAMIARFALMAEDYDLAFEAAQRVDESVLSEFRAGSLDANSLWVMWYGSGNAYALRAEEAFWADAEAGDQRHEYWVRESVITDAEENELPLDDVRRYEDRDLSYPVYLPDEMKLIQAEVYARDDELPSALALVNEVRTQCDSALDEPVACLPALNAADVPTQEAMLDQILQERGFELYLQAVRWQDQRRFGEPLKYDIMPIPVAECERNPSAP
ncbi:MAG TPA: RagB/SusD family nutrient uptake outer membrane protein, partial [Longimicrobiales bacterium]|nr:RagB/SusD family nutrient uptake outer membrane protein [Longimicrobiales bacterium]